MKKFVRCLVMLIVCLLVFPLGLSKAEPKINTLELFLDDGIVIVNGEKSSVLETAPFIYNQRMYISIRSLIETLNAKAEYYAEEKSVTLSNSKITLAIKYNLQKVTVNGKEVIADTPPFLIRAGRSSFSVRFICETFGATVSWDPVLHKATIVYEIPEN